VREKQTRMRFGLPTPLIIIIFFIALSVATQIPLLHHAETNQSRTISEALFVELEELSRIVDISYCVGVAGLGIQKPFECLGRCKDFENFELVAVSRICTSKA
jgi:hypothetical protein